MLGECPASASESAIEQYPVVMDEANVREESQDSMAEIRQILSTPVVVNEVDADIDMGQVTITAIIEELNKSMSSKGNSSTHEELQDIASMETLISNSNNASTQGSEGEPGQLVINEDTLEQSTRDELQSSLLGESTANNHHT